MLRLGLIPLVWMAAAGGAAVEAGPAPGEREAARYFWRAALDRFEALDSDSGVALLRGAIEADPGYFPPHETLLFGATRHRPVPSWYADLVRSRPDDPYFACLAAAVDRQVNYTASMADTLLALERRHGPTTCSTVLLVDALQTMTPPDRWRTALAERAQRATDSVPELPLPWLVRAALAGNEEGHEAAAAVLRTAALNVASATDRVWVLTELAGRLASAGDTGAALALRRALAMAVERDPRPAVGVRFVASDGLWPTPADLHDHLRRMVASAALARDALAELNTREKAGWALGNAGEVAEAIHHFDRVVQLADELGATGARSDGRVSRGRMLSKVGRYAEAENDLLEAIRLAPGERLRYVRAEAFHNLAHVYEGTGRLEEAMRAADRFIEEAAPLRHAQPRLMSLRDAALIRSKAGLHAAANELFDAMVAVVEEQGLHWVWAAQHFEQMGDLERALDYYQRSHRRDLTELALSLAGEARVLQALGRVREAEAAARTHDARARDQLDTPLLPRILAEQGRWAEAIASARAFAHDRDRGEHLQSRALARLNLADLLLRSGDPASAVAEADRARELAARGNHTAEWVEALRILGLGRVRLGETSRGLSLLRAAAAEADRISAPGLHAAARLALAEGMAAAGRTGEALHAFHGAARAVERVTATLSADLNRAGYRDRQMAPYDGALRILFAAEPVGSVDGALQWSQRRKAASLALAVGAAGGVLSTRPDALGAPAIMGRLPAGSALLDFNVLADAVAAIVVTPDTAAAVMLPVTTDELGRLVDRLRAPFTRTYGGQVDLARAPFDHQAAAALYRRLIHPLEPLLREAHELVLVPDGPLHHLPFDALLVAGGATDPVYLVDRWTTRTLPSAEFLRPAAFPRDRTARPRVLVVERDAPGGRDEVAGIREAWGAAGTTVLEGTAATESSTRRFMGRHGIVHFATHARADDRDPLASHLRLEADGTEDGLLHVAEIAGERVAASVVVLSACETVVGPHYRGEGLMGLARAFLVAGAESVVATRWPIGPATAELMATFHQGLADGRTVPEALRRARLRLRNDPATAHPFFWAPFVVVEGPGGRRTPSRTTPPPAPAVSGGIEGV